MTQMLRYHILQLPSQEQHCYLEDDIKGLKKRWLLSEGEPMGANMPPDASFAMSKDGGTKLVDFIPNKFGRLIVSEKARALLAREPINIEWLPVTLIDKKGRRVEAPYFIAHVLGRIECVDMERSRYARSAFDPTEVVYFDSLLLDEPRIPPEAVLFRIREAPRTFIIRADLFQRLTEAGVTGLALLELGAPVNL